ncbi:PREDICTED: uncharacterized protein LOC18605526 isoform X2 [Theobroma cacao]|uniref:Uncharacterized protein LOC18605526 isoform X2 n=2 Tax=Theobroma cacao TaxID=3641 RepID=A0AB32VB59_THECC|nr:PREDICTED: uncharacterized protein LOC18605526 isoform X2 [Theobroma cacao]EOY23137.1 Uncharacterized protein TCM_015122 isoform 2 [Theobroma cacao]
MDSHVPSDRNDPWTNEKHVHFLNSMEAWFVRTMLENDGRHNLRLDRHLPDSSESTLDCKPNQTRKKHATSDFIGTTGSKRKGRPDKRARRPPSKPHDSSQDQVVPQIENRTGDKDEEDLPNVPVASMAPAN